MVDFDAPSRIQCSTCERLISEASPKAISRRTSYLRVRLEFLPYPQLITTLFNGCVFGPPQPFTAASSWSWVGHPVSGPYIPTCALFTLGLPSARFLKNLTSPVYMARRTVLQKVHDQTLYALTYHCPLAACRHKVSGSLSLPSRGSFHRSLTVLSSIGH